MYSPVPCDVTSLFYSLSFHLWWVVYKECREMPWTPPPSVIDRWLFPFSRSVCPSHKSRSCWLQGLSLFPVPPLHHTVSGTFLLKLTLIRIVPLEWSGCGGCYFPAINIDITVLQPLQDWGNTVILDGSHFRETSDRWLFAEGKEFNSSASPHCDDGFPPPRK